ncbi:S8 family serine peptidase [Streptomyces chumphonensis]|uniref:S8 family serine peptidase n=1 Tax=Streptomyces chumphonensis TaxID=1214925 RepID=UPI003D75E68F
MWNVSRGEGVTVAVVDSGVNASSETLKGRILPGEDLTDRPGSATDDYHGHGTAMAELIAGSGEGGGIKGLAPGVEILPLRVTVAEWVDSEDSSIAEAVRKAAESDAKILNISIASSHQEELETAIDYAVSKGKLIFAGTGNSGGDKDYSAYPAGYRNVVGVGAVTKENKVADYSQGGNVDLTAPGSDFPGWCDNEFVEPCTTSGTSNAAAIASASAALIWAEHPDWTANQVLRVMMQTASKAIDGSDYTTRLGYGTVRPRKVLLDGEGDPGDPDQHPLLKVEESPSPSAQPEGGSSDGDESASERVKVADQGEDGPPTGLLIGSGVAVVLLAAGVIGFLVLRRR